MCGGAKWKREEVPDHKFDFVDTREFTDNGFIMRMKYLFLYAVVLKSFLVYLSDIFTAITMLSTKDWSNQIYKRCSELQGCVFVDFTTAKYIFFGCILFGFLLLAYEAHKAKKIIASRDISFTFTNVMANNYYSLRSYDHFCLFDHIKDSTKTSDDFAFFVFFTFKSWKRLILSDGPRQTINAFILYALFLVKKDQGPWYDVSKYFAGNSISTSALLVTTLFTLVVFTVSLIILIVAGICYVPLLFHIRGNLKEYCCYKVDKRIGDVIKRRQKQRLADAARFAKKEAMGDFSHLKNKKGEFIAKPLPQPTLPNLSIDDEPTEVSTIDTRVAPSPYTQEYHYYNHDDYPPPMPSYMAYPGQYPYNPSSATIEDASYNHPMYDDDNESTAHLATSAAPFAHHPSSPAPYARHTPSPVPRTQPSPYNNGVNQIGSSLDVYQEHAGHASDAQLRFVPTDRLAYVNDNGTHHALHVGHQDTYTGQTTMYHPSQGRGPDYGRGHDGGYNGGYAM
ncbi:hypothetical protein AX15_002335 [Amanita polypyramis BW_CC]|nr:hypothetical protein AX15_002335 [Amanita polypyramis BW_CC]